MKEMALNEKYLIGLSGGINSMAVLCWLIEQPVKPQELHLFYAHFEEHSPDTFQFVADGIRLARKHFNEVKVKITKNSILRFFEEKKMILHPARGLCSFQLKIEPINRYAFENGITVDLIGYVKHELKRRSEKQKTKAGDQVKLFTLKKEYPIGDFSNEWCFEIVKKHIGWYPAIYDLEDSMGDKAFHHNNCLPCKNSTVDEFNSIKNYYPEYYQKAIRLSAKLGSYYGRSEADFYTEFGRDLGQDTTCETCKF